MLHLLELSLQARSAIYRIYTEYNYLVLPDALVIKLPWPSKYLGNFGMNVLRYLRKTNSRGAGGLDNNLGSWQRTYIYIPGRYQ